MALFQKIYMFTKNIFTRLKENAFSNIGVVKRRKKKRVFLLSFLRGIQKKVKRKKTIFKKSEIQSPSVPKTPNIGVVFSPCFEKTQKGVSFTKSMCHNLKK